VAGRVKELLKAVAARARGALSGGARYHARLMHPPGHFYSPIPNLKEVRRRADRIFDRTRRELPGIDLNEAGQLELLRQFAGYYAEMPFRDGRQPGLRYFFDNPYFAHSDAVFLYCVLRHFRPQRVVEVGSGFSSAVMLDTSERFLDRKVRFTFIEPYPERLCALLTPEDAARVTILERPVQDVDARTFEALGAGDVLFIDSTHVAKAGSDVGHLLFEVLPALKPGVLVHFHDVFHPFEYPEAWVMSGRAWNEAYMLHAFLIGNAGFQVVAFNTFLAQFHADWFREHMPACLENTGGSLWLRRI
jgi:predicted O-methyltransferase YrrM